MNIKAEEREKSTKKKSEKCVEGKRRRREADKGGRLQL